MSFPGRELVRTPVKSSSAEGEANSLLGDLSNASDDSLGQTSPSRSPPIRAAASTSSLVTITAENKDFAPSSTCVPMSASPPVPACLTGLNAATQRVVDDASDSAPVNVIPLGRQIARTPVVTAATLLALEEESYTDASPSLPTTAEATKVMPVTVQSREKCEVRVNPCDAITESFTRVECHQDNVCDSSLQLPHVNSDSSFGKEGIDYKNLKTECSQKFARQIESDASDRISIVRDHIGKRVASPAGEDIIQIKFSQFDQDTCSESSIENLILEPPPDFNSPLCGNNIESKLFTSDFAKSSLSSQEELPSPTTSTLNIVDESLSPITSIGNIGDEPPSPTIPTGNIGDYNSSPYIQENGSSPSLPMNVTKDSIHVIEKGALKKYPKKINTQPDKAFVFPKLLHNKNRRGTFLISPGVASLTVNPNNSREILKDIDSKNSIFVLEADEMRLDSNACKTVLDLNATHANDRNRVEETEVEKLLGIAETPVRNNRGCFRGKSVRETIVLSSCAVPVTPVVQGACVPRGRLLYKTPVSSVAHAKDHRNTFIKIDKPEQKDICEEEEEEATLDHAGESKKKVSGETENDVAEVITSESLDSKSIPSASSPLVVDGNKQLEKSLTLNDTSGNGTFDDSDSLFPCVRVKQLEMKKNVIKKQASKLLRNKIKTSTAQEFEDKYQTGKRTGKNSEAVKNGGKSSGCDSSGLILQEDVIIKPVRGRGRGRVGNTVRSTVAKKPAVETSSVDNLAIESNPTNIVDSPIKIGRQPKKTCDDLDTYNECAIPKIPKTCSVVNDRDILGHSPERLEKCDKDELFAEEKLSPAHSYRASRKREVQQLTISSPASGVNAKQLLGLKGSKNSRKRGPTKSDKKNDENNLDLCLSISLDVKNETLVLNEMPRKIVKKQRLARRGTPMSSVNIPETTTGARNAEVGDDEENKLTKPKARCTKLNTKAAPKEVYQPDTGFEEVTADDAVVVDIPLVTRAPGRVGTSARSAVVKKRGRKVYAAVQASQETDADGLSSSQTEEVTPTKMTAGGRSAAKSSDVEQVDMAISAKRNGRPKRKVLKPSYLEEQSGDEATATVRNHSIPTETVARISSAKKTDSNDVSAVKTLIRKTRKAVPVSKKINLSISDEKLHENLEEVTVSKVPSNKKNIRKTRANGTKKPNSPVLSDSINEDQLKSSLKRKRTLTRKQPSEPSTDDEILSKGVTSGTKVRRSARQARVSSSSDTDEVMSPEVTKTVARGKAQSRGGRGRSVKK